MMLSQLIDGISGIEVVNFKDVEITRVTADSGSCRPGSLFFAIRGARRNGIDFIPDAYKAGARVFVCAEKIGEIADSVIVYTKTPRKTLAELCSKISGNPEKRLMFVGITGTKGKTTTAYFVSKILEKIGISNLLIGTLGVGEDKKSANTTPDPTVLFPSLRDAAHRGVKVVVLEVSSQALKDYRVYGISFDTVVFTGLGEDHVGDFEHPTFADYVASKRMLFNSYGAKRAVINFDDPYASYMSAGVPKVIKCGFTRGVDFFIEGFVDGKEGSRFKINGIPVKCKLSGEYNARNVALALGVIKEISGVDVKNSAERVEDISVPGRFNVFSVCGVFAVVDYAHNYDSAAEVLALARRIFSGRIICVFGSVGDRSFQRRKALARAAEERAYFSVITADSSEHEPPISVCADIYDAFIDKTRAKIIPCRACAIDYAMRICERGDAVLILGRGHEENISIMGERIPFSDIEYVKKLAEDSFDSQARFGYPTSE